MIENAAYYIGIVGAFMYLTSYFLLQAGFVRGNSYTYTLLNMFAATCVVISLFDAFNAASLIIQISWILISIFGLIRMTMVRYSIRFTEEEEEFVERKFPGVPRNIAKTLLKNAVWIDGKDQTELTRKGVQNENLIYLVEGRADVIVDGRKLATIPAGSFIGELTCLNGGPATADVKLSGDGRYVAMSAQRIRASARRDLDLRTFLELSIAKDVQTKLESYNQSIGNPAPALASV